MPVVNVDGVAAGTLVIDGATLAKIVMGEIKTWNDPAIAKLNPSAKLPSQAIADVLSDVRRAEAHLAAGRFEEATLYARALDRPERFGYDVVLIAHARTPAPALPKPAVAPRTLVRRLHPCHVRCRRRACRGRMKKATNPWSPTWRHRSTS